MALSRLLQPVLVTSSLLLLIDAGHGRASCQFLMPIQGGGEPVVEKRISADGLLRRNNWNTDFAVDRNYASYRITLQSASTERGVFPVAAFQQQVVFGPFPAVPDKRTNQVNVRVGATAMPRSTGFSYRVSVEGCS
jgi:hypothetical protein